MPHCQLECSHHQSWEHWVEPEYLGVGVAAAKEEGVVTAGPDFLVWCLCCFLSF